MNKLLLAVLTGLLVVSAYAEKKKIVFVAGRESHGNMAHNHKQGCEILAKALEESGLPIETDLVAGGWPQNPESFFKDADAVIIYCDGGGGHVVNRHLEAFDRYMKKGVGLGCIHYAVEVPKGPSGDKMLNWIGGYFETHWSVNPHWVAEFTSFPDHPVAHGVKPFSINDEWYFHMRFPKGMAGVTPILSAIAPESTMKRGNGPHSGNPFVRKSVAAREKQHLAWVTERIDGGRGFGFTGAHFHKNWADDNFRKVVLNAIAWIAKVDVPKNGVSSKTPEIVATGNRKGGKTVSAPAGINPKGAKFASKVITKQTPGYAVDIKADLSGSKELWLVAMDGGDGYGCDWVAWVDPVIEGDFGKKALTDLPWESVSSGYGQVRVNQNCTGGQLAVRGRPVKGFGAHANSVISFKLPKGTKSFSAKGALEEGGTKQSCGSTVQFFVFDKKPQFLAAPKRKSNPGSNGDLAAENAVANIDTYEGLESTLFASEPMMLSPSCLEIDDRGRIWVGEVVNYRRNRGKRPEGDRILILEDTNQDGKADKSTTFYQGTDIDSLHGLCILDSRVIVSAGDKVLNLYDLNGDDKADKVEVMFSGISGAQHDHGIHAFMFGPDGKLYFNFGNTGRQIKDAEGKPIIDSAGNEVNDKRNPYQQGMVFRCNLDGSEFETLGWNFRNNWEVTVDSFGTMWQSDNDDDGNRSVRINYVMEFGNYGYRDEKSGAGWKSARTGMHTEIPLKHWHLNDPGVVPNLLQTGAGSPTGICVYEATLLPEIFQGQVIHCDAGPNVTRAYPVKNDGAGYSAEMVPIQTGTRNRWYRPSDVHVAPDGSLFVADWFDPGVGGHGMRDLDHGRVFRVAPPKHSYVPPSYDYRTVAGAVAALKSPNNAARFKAWKALVKFDKKSIRPLFAMSAQGDPRHRARAFWCLGKIPAADAGEVVERAISDSNSDIRIVGLRLARQADDVDEIEVVKKLMRDSSPQVRRECAIAIRHHTSEDVPAIWATLAEQHDGKDRWYLEALGIAADRNWNACFEAWYKRAGGKIDSAAKKDIVWRSRAPAACALLADIVKSTPPEEHPRYMRAFDFHEGPEKDKALASILGL